MGMIESERRRAANEATFRDANERLSDRARSLKVPDVPFLCECEDTSCTAVVMLTLAEYEDVRAHPARFLVRPGHGREPGEHVVATGVRYGIVEKVGIGAAVARARNPRS
jgi:hypothetical protein